MKTSAQTKQFSLSELIKDLDVTFRGDPHCMISGISTIQNAEQGHVTFLMNSLYKKYLSTTKASAVILSAEDAKECLTNAIITNNPYYIYSKIAAFFNTRLIAKSGLHTTAVIGEHCQIDASAYLGPHCVVGDHVKISAHVTVGPGCVIGDYSEIGDSTKIDANVTLYDSVKIGKRVFISSGAVIGSDGFGLAKEKNTWHKVPQLGGVIVEDDVEIGANTTIDRGAIEDTVIEKGVKLDNLIQVGHNVRIGENTAIAGCVAIAGSATIGKNCIIGGCTGIAGHIVLTDHVVITGGTEVSKSIREPGIYSSGVGGVVTNIERRKNTARVQRLDQLIQRVKELERKVT